MRRRTDQLLDPAPFRAWVDQRLAAPGRGPESLGELAGTISVDDLARDLGLVPRRLYCWRFEVKSLDRIDVEEALHRAGYAIWDVYPGLDLIELPAQEPNRGGVLPGTTGKLRDPQFELLHRLHVERGMSIREMARRIWEPTGYASTDAADFAIRKGWKRLGLPAKRRSDLPTALGRCKGFKNNYPGKGSRCKEPAMVASDYCREHDPARRAEVLRQAAKARERVRAAA